MKKIIKLILFLIIAIIALPSGCFAYNCNYHAFRDCLGSAVYWYDSCSNIQDLYQNCSNYNLTCKYGQCVPIVLTSDISNYKAHFKKACQENFIYWYDSAGKINDFYQSCVDSNSCTIDSCTNGKCENVLKCDGTTCLSESNDYNTYCISSKCGNGVCDEDLGEDKNNCEIDCNSVIQQINILAVSFFAKKEISGLQWNKSVQIGQNENIYFLIDINNNSNSQVGDVSVFADIPQEISYLGNLKIDGVPVSGDIISGISVGSVQPNAKKSITFEGKTQSFNIEEEKQAVAFIDSNQSDLVFLNFAASLVNAVSTTSSPFQKVVEFLKRWFMWIITGIILVFLFMVVFKRVSSNV